VKRIGVLISGRGSNLQALIDAQRMDHLGDGEIAVVISNTPGAFGLTRARLAGIPSHVCPHQGKKRAEYDLELLAILKEKSVALVCLAGFMRLLSPGFIEAYRGRILNIHPSLLPAFKGLDAQQQACDYGVKWSGATVHLVDEDLDAGPIVAQEVVPVHDDDTAESLSSRILEVEHRIYPEAVRVILSGHYRIEGRRLVRLEETT
jgi:phosphoribosylglycinamide formyltransferase-1